MRAVALANARTILAERQRIERELNEQRERLRVTLASIGDAVISTDAEGRVVFLNGVAEQLTGWSSAEAKGLPLTEIFHIVNATTRRLVENPALQALVEGRVVALANHTLLIARDGTERAIEDSAAPIRGESGDTLGAVLVFRDVTDRMRADMARAQLATIVESSQDAIVSKTLDGTILSWNAGATRIFGYTAAEAIGQPITLIIPADRRDEEPGILERMRRGEQVDHFDTVRVTKDGRRLDISLTISPIRDDEGHVVAVSKIGRDITERTRDAAALRQSEARHRFLSGLAAATQNATDPREVMATTARLLAKHLGVDRCAFAEVEEEVIFVITGDYASGVPSIVGRWPIAAFGAECERAMGANEAYVVDDVDTDPRVGADLAAYRQTNIQAVICVPLHKAGKLTAAMAVHQTTARSWTAEEISLVQTVVAGSWESLERIRVTRGLIESARRLEIALAAAHLGDWSWESTSDWVTLSPRAATIFGIAAGRQRTWTQMRDILHPDDRERVRIAVEQSVADRTPYDVEYRLLRGDREVIWVSAKGSAQYGPAGDALGVFGVVQDITERKHLEQELRNRAVELADADRKKDEFIALLAHELRNPLAPIRTGLQVLRRAGVRRAEGAPPGGGQQDRRQSRDRRVQQATVEQARSMMERQVTHMVRLVDDLMDTSRINLGKLDLRKEQLPLATVLNSAVETSRPLLEQMGHKLTVTLPEQPITVDADMTRLAQVFLNLLNNAAKYSERGGHIQITVERQSSDAVVTVKDTGIGIDADQLPRIFAMFTQLGGSFDRSQGGLGIGLTLVKRLVEMHGGSVEAKSEGPGLGSEFVVRLPVLIEAPQPQTSGMDDAPSAMKPSLRILIVDDNRDGADSLSEMLKITGNDTRTAYDGQEGVDMAGEFQPDVILLDIGLPKLNGYEACRLIREQPKGKGVVLIAVTGWGQVEDRRRSREAGFDHHMVKPVDPQALIRILAELVVGQEKL